MVEDPLRTRRHSGSTPGVGSRFVLSNRPYTQKTVGSNPTSRSLVRTLPPRKQRPLYSRLTPDGRALFFQKNNLAVYPLGRNETFYDFAR